MKCSGYAWNEVYICSNHEEFQLWRMLLQLKGPSF